LKFCRVSSRPKFTRHQPQNIPEIKQKITKITKKIEEGNQSDQVATKGLEMRLTPPF